MHILIYTDHYVITSTIKDILGREHIYKDVNTSKDILNVITTKYDVLIVDMDDVTLDDLKRIKTTYPKLKIAVLKSTIDKNYITELFKIKIKCIIKKPFNFNVLKGKLQEL